MRRKTGRFAIVWGCAIAAATFSGVALAGDGHGRTDAPGQVMNETSAQAQVGASAQAETGASAQAQVGASVQAQAQTGAQAQVGAGVQTRGQGEAQIAHSSAPGQAKQHSSVGTSGSTLGTCSPR